MKNFFETLLKLVNEFQGYIYVFIIGAALIYGITLVYSEEGTEKLKKRLPAIIIGVVLCATATAIGAYYGKGFSY